MLALCVGTAMAQDSQPHRLAVVEGLASPEAVSFDPHHGAYLVSNANGPLGVKHDSGFISRITANGKLDSLHFIQGGRNGVVLNAPMGSRVRGDTLWVLDVDALRAFDTRSGKPLTMVDLAPLGAHFLNDLTFAPNGDIYITDTGVEVAPDGRTTKTVPGRIFRISRDGHASLVLRSQALAAPDGIGWDRRDSRLVLAPFGGMAVQSWHPGDAAPRDVAPGKGKFDGVEVEPDGSVLITSWNDSSVATLNRDRLVRRIANLSMTPADVTMDVAHARVGIVSLTANRFELWSWPWK
ncbi:MAG: SMP-30/gluconolactonase/LRE family protein [Gemmatimonadaceae bacterium]